MIEVIRTVTTAIAVALYNGERFLEEQLDSLRTQTLSPDRVVFCDDGSKDGTVSLVRDYIARHGLSDRWELICNEENLGYVRNFYKAVSLCDTDLVFLCDQDDIWVADKIEKMTRVMESREEISLLSCRYGIIDASGERQQSIVEESAREDEELCSLQVLDILRAYRWPGMVMCLRKSFFDEIVPILDSCSTAHDLMFCLLAADRDGFYEYGYLGAYHRRHGNNTAREEHRVSKLLNLERKLKDISVTRKLWESFFDADVPMKEDSLRLIRRRYESLLARERALKEKSLKKVLQVYRNDPDGFLRKKSLICDLWLVLFGKRGKQ